MLPRRIRHVKLSPNATSRARRKRDLNSSSILDWIFDWKYENKIK
jgi:hypothetical protein